MIHAVCILATNRSGRAVHKPICPHPWRTEGVEFGCMNRVACHPISGKRCDGSTKAVANAMHGFTTFNMGAKERTDFWQHTAKAVVETDMHWKACRGVFNTNISVGKDICATVGHGGAAKNQKEITVVAALRANAKAIFVFEYNPSPNFGCQVFVWRRAWFFSLLKEGKFKESINEFGVLNIIDSFCQLSSVIWTHFRHINLPMLLSVAIHRVFQRGHDPNALSFFHS